MKNYKLFKIVINLLLACLSAIFYILGFVYFFKYISKIVPCSNAYHMCGEMHCPDYLWNAIVFAGFYLLFMLVIFVVFKYLLKSFSFFFSMGLVPTLYIVLIQVLLVYEANDLNNIGPDQIRANDINEIYLFLSVFTLLLIGMIISLWSWLRRERDENDTI